jgi:hypothetical protein
MMSTPESQLNFSLSEKLRREEREFEEKARLEIEHLQNRDPDRTRRVMAIQNTTGLPFEVADASLEDLEKRVTEGTFEYDKWRKESPVWTQFAAENPYHLSVLKDDQEGMTWYERTSKQIGLGFDSTWALNEISRMAELRIAQGGEYTPEQQGYVDNLKKLQTDHEFGAEGFAGFLVKNAKMFGPTWAAVHAGLERGWMGMAAGGTAALVMGQAGPQVAVPEEIITGPALATMGGAIGFQSGMAEKAARMEGSFAYEEYRDMGLSHDTALYAASAVGGVNAILETAGLNLIMRAIPGAKHLQGRMASKLVGDVLAKPTVGKATAMAAANFGAALGGEVITEGLQEGVTATMGLLIQPEDAEVKMTWEDVTDRVADAMIETLQGAFIISSLGPSMTYYGDVRKARAAKANELMWEALGQSAKAMKIRETLPKTAREFVDRVAGESGLSHVHMNVREWDRYWQGQNEDSNKIANQLGISADELQEAREMDGTVSIKLTEYTQQIAATDHHKQLARHLKRDPDDYSAVEAAEFEANKPEALRSLEKAMKDLTEAEDATARQRIIDDVTGQLLQANVEKWGATQLAQLMGGVATMAHRAGLDPGELYQQVFGGVTRVRDVALQRQGDVDLTLDPYLNMLREKKFPTQRQMFGPTLIDFIKSKGGLLDEGGELTARDAGLEHPGLVRPKAGKSLDAMAEAAAEAGYLPPGYTPNQLLDALDRELKGEPVRSRFETGDPRLQDLGTMLDQLQDELGMAGLDVDTMTNEEIRRRLKALERFNQLSLEEMTQLLGAMDEAQAAVEEADVVGADLAAAFDIIDVMAASVDFGNVEITDTVRIRESGETVEMTASAQDLFDEAKQSRDNALRLMDCIK